MGRLVYLRDVVTLKLDEGKCVGCGMCLSVCPHAVLGLIDGNIEIRDRDACIECGACARNCPVAAVSVRSGVGCAAAVINAALGRKRSSCCAIDPEERSGDPASCSSGANPTNCC